MRQRVQSKIRKRLRQLARERGGGTFVRILNSRRPVAQELRELTLNKGAGWLFRSYAAKMLAIYCPAEPCALLLALFGRQSEERELLELP